MSLAKDTKIFITGHLGMVGAATLDLMKRQKFSNLLTASSKELDLTDQAAVIKFFSIKKPEVVVLCAAKVGGIQANIDNPATFLLDNLQIQNNVMSASLRCGVKQFIFLGSSCIYPKECKQPMVEDDLLSGKLEPTNEGYAVAKIAGIKLLEGLRRQYRFNSISLIPCNLYGPGDSFDLTNSHVLSALVKRFVDATRIHAPSITLWGTGTARREFMHVHDMARAIVFMLENYLDEQIINIGTGEDLSILDLAKMITTLTGYSGKILWDESKPDGMLRKCMDVNRMRALGFRPEISLMTGVTQMIKSYKEL
jgi:GDP-L-fucose synthase